MAQRIEERLDKLERTFDSTVSALADTTSDILLRQLGLQDALEQKGILSDPDVRARMQALSDYAELQLNLEDTDKVRGELRRFRALRRLLKGKPASSERRIWTR